MWRQAVDVGAVGIEMGAAVFIGYVAGDWLDGKYDTSPYLGLTGLLVGVAAAGNALWNTARKMNKDQTP
jgi:F0F1-type ATP synthase assembly protein I